MNNIGMGISHKIRHGNGNEGESMREWNETEIGNTSPVICSEGFT